MQLTRRHFFGTSAAAVLTAGGFVRSHVFGANERVRFGIIGLRSRGITLAETICGIEDAEIVALCDPDAKVLESSAAKVGEKTGKAPKTYHDLRDLLAANDVDAVIVATPNHWHTLAAIWACQAGKHVYVEKPVSNTLWEGRQLVAASEKYGRVIQVGTQRRSDPSWQRATQRVRDGVIGDIYMARAIYFSRRESIGFGEEMAPPPHLDWSLWQGPAPDRPFRDYNPKPDEMGLYVHYNWHWFWHWGNGELGNNGVHLSDVVDWTLQKGLPVRVHSTGGRFGYKDAAETPNTQVCTYTYADGTMLVCEVRNLFTNEEAGMYDGNLFYGSKGYMAGGKCYDEKGNEIPDENKPEESGDIVNRHIRNFIKAVRSGNHDDIPAKAINGHIAAGICHLGNISYRLGRSVQFDPATERFVNDPEADKLLTREYRPGFEVPQLA